MKHGDIGYLYFGRRLQGEHNGVITAAFRVDSESSDRGCILLNIGMAYCSPRDQFNKTMARKIATNRINSRSGFFTAIDQHDKETRINDVVVEACNAHIERNKSKTRVGDDGRHVPVLPRWLRGITLTLPVKTTMPEVT